MEKQRREESSFQQPPWIPQTPMKPFSPICPYTVEDQYHSSQLEERRFVGNKDMSGLDHLSFGDLLALANTASLIFSGQTPIPTRNTEVMQKGTEEVESLSSVSNNVAEQILKTPEKPKRKKHRPKVRREAKPKREPKPRAPRKSVVTDGQESKTPKRKYVRKKVEVSKDQDATPVESSAAVETSTRPKRLCRRVLDFEAENGENQTNGDIREAGEMESALQEKQLDSGNQELKDCLLSAPSTPKRKRSQGKRKGVQPKKNGSNLEEVDISMAQAAKRRQGPTCCDMNLSGIQYDEQCDYQKMHWLYSPNLQQGGMRYDAICSKVFSGQQHNYVSAFHATCYSSTSQLSANRVLTVEERREGIFQGRQESELNVLSDKIDTPIKKKTTGHARFRNLSSMNKLVEVPEHLTSGYCSKPQQNNKILVDTRVTVSKKKPTKSEKSQTKQKNLLPNLCRFPPSFTGLSPDELWKRRNSIETISELLRLLDINREHSETALVPYTMNSQIVLFGGGAGAIVPVTPVKKPRPRPKVDLDDETDRVWKLLLENINSEGVDGSDEQKAKWWEEERNVFRGRADSFIARMHLVQGDRRFTPWKGSVVDSVVGVFLTQNVSDHLSSSAFMSLASQFPVPFVPSSNFDAGTSSMPSIQITYLDSEETMSSPPDHNHSSVTLKNTQPDEEKDYVPSNETSRSSSEIAISAHESVDKTTDSKEYVDSDRKGSSVEVDKTDEKCRVLNLFPSEDSALTCQHSMVSDAPQNTERAGSSSEIDLEGEYRTSFMKLLQGVQVSLEDSNQVSPNMSPGDCSSEIKGFQSMKEPTKSSVDSSEPGCCSQQDGDVLSCQKPTLKEKGKKVLKEEKKSV